MIVTLLIIAGAYASYGVLAYGGTLADLQGTFPRCRELVVASMMALSMGLLGPIGLIATACIGRFEHGLQFIPKKSESW